MPRTAPIKAVRGVRDILPEERALWRVAERAAARVAHRFGYREIQTPVIEHAELIERVGADTDAVAKELYRFEDRGGRQLALRPEATAGVPGFPYAEWPAAAHGPTTQSTCARPFATSSTRPPRAATTLGFGARGVRRR